MPKGTSSPSGAGSPLPCPRRRRPPRRLYLLVPFAGLPLGDTRTTAAQVEMRNILGSDIENAHEGLADARLHLHDYGKAEASEGRKMGHATLITHDASL